MKELTKKQSKALCLISEFINKNEIAPSMRELSVLMGYTDANSVESFVQALEFKGFIKRTSGAHRSLRLTEKANELLFGLTPKEPKPPTLSNEILMELSEVLYMRVWSNPEEIFKYINDRVNEKEIN